MSLMCPIDHLWKTYGNYNKLTLLKNPLIRHEDSESATTYINHTHKKRKYIE